MKIKTARKKEKDEETKITKALQERGHEKDDREGYDKKKTNVEEDDDKQTKTENHK